MYKAKSDGTTIKQHNEDLMYIKNQIKEIYNIDDKMSKSLDKCIKYHDIGKVVNSFQNNIESKHRIMRHEVLSASYKDLSDNERLAIITHHKERKNLIQYIENENYYNEVLEMSGKLDIEIEDVRDFIRYINKSSNTLVKDIDNILLKGYLQYCDHLASAGIKNIDKGFNALENYKYTKYNSIQRKVLELEKDKDVLLIAPTGLGKTSTSLYWSDLNQNNEKSKRVYYILPYTASINSMYKDMQDKNISVSMLHSKVDAFLDKEEVSNIKEIKDIFQKSIKQINISTIYQIIKVIFSCKRYEMLLSQFKNSLFIIDEVHCFDIKQLSLLLTTLRFLKDKLGIKICIMSASIPTILINIIKKELGIEKVIRANKEDYIIRHKIHRINEDLKENINNIIKDLNSGKQVLICVNSVKLAQEIYSELKEYKPKLIHGRFNDRDRNLIEEGIKECRLLIGTQAIEVSLDISYDVLYTELAPFDSLQQRFGRVNRKGEKGISDIFIYNNTSYIYDENTLNMTDEIINDILIKENGIIKEENISVYLDRIYPEINELEYQDNKETIEFLIDTLEVAKFSKNITDNMGISGNIRVLPSSLLSEYMDLIDNKEYIKANSLFVNISNKRIKDLYIHKIGERNIYICDYIYDDRGLVYEENNFII